VGNYLFVSDLKPGEIVELTFPIRETTARYTVNAQSPAEMSYTCTFRGSTLVDISPRDTAPTSLQLYRREAQRQSAVPLLRQVPRFVPDRVVRGW